jgi:hypothetical protein
MVSVVAPTYSLKGKPHWRRTQEVYRVLNQASAEETYDHLIEYVRIQTGKGCSRKLISKWKKLTIQDGAIPPSSPNPKSKPKPKERTPVLELQLNTEELLVKDEPLVTETPSQSPPVETTLETNQSDINSIQNPKSKIPNQEVQNPFTERVLQVAKNTWSYVAATTIVLGIAGCGWFLSKDNSQPVIAQTTSIQNSEFKIQNEQPSIQNPKSKIQNGLPRTIKIDLTLSSPQDLKVKPGDEVTPGTVLSDRTTERQRLLAQKKQLQLSLKKLDLPIPELTPPKAIPALTKLPPVSYQQEEANIALKQQELAEAERAIANQEIKIKELELLLNSESIQSSKFKIQNELFPNQGQINSESSQFDIKKLSSNTNSIQNPKSKIQNPLAAILEHEESILSQLKAGRDKAKLQLDIAKSQLLTAKERRAHAEYQRYVEETKRAIALQQQRIELERQRSIRAGQIQEREYSKAQIETKIQEIDNAISNLSTVKAPYPGRIKKVKWTGQDNHHLTVQLTLDVDDGSESGDITVSRQQ